MAEPQFLLTLTQLPPDLSPTLQGQTVRLKRLPATLGRGKDATITVKHRSLSRLHCRFYLTDGRLAVKDLASTNGTWINGHRIREDSYVQVGDQIMFGSIGFHLSLLETRMPERAPESVPKTMVESSRTVVTHDADHLNGAKGTDLSDRSDRGQPLSEEFQGSGRGDTVRVQAVAESESSSVGIMTDPAEAAHQPAAPLLDTEDLRHLVEVSLPSDWQHEPAGDDDSQDSDPQFSSPNEEFAPGEANDQAVVFFEADDRVPEGDEDPGADEEESATGNPPTAVQDLPDAGRTRDVEREMGVEGALRGASAAQLMKQHALDSGPPGHGKENRAAENLQPLKVDLSGEGGATPIVPDRPEDRSQAPVSDHSSEDVIEIQIPGRPADVSSVNIETSFVAGGSSIDLGSFASQPSEHDPSAEDLVIEDPGAFKNASLSALGQFFDKRKRP